MATPVKTEPIKVMRLNGMSLSKIIWRRFKRPMEGLAEQTLELNPGLAALGPILPYKTEFNLPIPVIQEEVKLVPVVRIWGKSL